jgi:hypothetical protein
MQQVINKGQIMNNANYYFCEQKERQEKNPYIPSLYWDWIDQKNKMECFFGFIKEILTKEITPLF